jgi:putative nucleotidyltransferase with HDIG domain
MSLFDRIFKVHIARQFFIFLILTSTIPLVVLGFLSYQVSRSSLTKEVNAHSLQMLIEKQQAMEFIMGSVESLIRNVSGVSDINDVLQQNKLNNNRYNKLATQAKMGYILSSYLNLTGLVSIDLFSMAGEHFHVGDTLNIEETRDDVRDNLFRQAAASESLIVWTGIEDNVNKNSRQRKVLTAVRLLKVINIKTLVEKPIGLLVVNYSVDVFYDSLMNNPSKHRIYIVVDGRNRIVFHPDKRLIGAEINPGLLGRMLSQREDEPFSEKIDGVEMIAMHSHFANSGWRLITLVPQATVNEGLAEIRLNAIMAVLFCLACAVLFSWLISRNIVEPIRSMTNLFQKIQDGTIDLTIRLEEKSRNEIGELVRWFNAFLKNLVEKRQAEEEIARLNGELEQRVMSRTADLAAANLELKKEIASHQMTEEARQKNLEKLRQTLSGIIQAVAMMVESRDPYTAGHQRRVSDLGRTIAQEMGLSTDETDGIRIAGMLHDIGKISIPAEILSKPGRLSDIEFSLIKAHAETGHNILKEIDFPWPIATIVLQHHERIDGSGYPRSLKGDEICIEARILTVADVVEAMASHRPYRPGLGIDAALNEIEKNKGIFYDNAVADACLRLFREKDFKLEGA